MGGISNHSVRQMLARELSLTFCTDNRLMSHISVVRELTLALEDFDIAPDHLRDIIAYEFKRSFYYHPYPMKRKWVRQVIDSYEALEKKLRIS